MKDKRTHIKQILKNARCMFCIIELNMQAQGSEPQCNGTLRMLSGGFENTFL